MKKTSIALVSLGFLGAAALTVVNCGGTGGDLGESPTGIQAVNTSCSPESNCLSLTVSPRALAADNASTATFTATLRDGSGNPIASVEICFRMEDPGIATIFEPVDGCQFTNGNGQVSGRLRSTDKTGSSKLIAEGNRLQATQTLVFGNACLIDLTPDTGSLSEDESEFLQACIECSDNSVLRGATVSFSSDCGLDCSISPSSATTGNNGCAGASLLNTNGASTSVQVNITASASGVGSDTSTFVMEGTAAAGTLLQGDPCTAGAQCVSGACSGTTNTCLGDTGDPCDANNKCASGVCDIGGTNTCT